MKTFLRHILPALMSALMLVACVDDDLYTNAQIPDGDTVLDVSVSFPTFAPALDSRSTGNAIKKIESLWIAIYERDDDGGWTLEDGGLIRITSSEHHLAADLTDNGTNGAIRTEAQTGHATFSLRHICGQFKIYAVANHDMSAIDRRDIDTPEKLKRLRLVWNSADINDNSEMFGCFSNEKQTDMNDYDDTVIISPGRTLHAWIRRAASKLTIAFDTRRLNDNVTIYLKSVTIKDIPKECYIGETNTPSADREGISNELMQGEILYFTPTPDVDDYTLWRKLTKETGIWGYRSEMGHPGAPPAGLSNNPSEQTVAERLEWEHNEATDAIYFYENMQGEGKSKAQTAPGPGNGNGDKYGIGYPDPVEGDEASGWKDSKAYGSYVEVEGYYTSTSSGKISSGKIKYRFMLGKNTSTDYNAERNHHYRLTLMFNGSANDIDWHIEYREKVQILEVTKPKTVNYMGRFFVPDNSKNRGHKFSSDNIVTITSYTGYTETENDRNFNEWQISYRETGSTGFLPGLPSWIKAHKGDINNDSRQQVTFTVESEYVSVDIDKNLKAAPPKGNEKAYYNLANTGGGPDYVECTANCYMIGAAGYYMLPLVYGNSIHKGQTNEKSYKYSGGTGDNMLSVFQNHLGTYSSLLQEDNRRTEISAITLIPKREYFI